MFFDNLQVVHTRVAMLEETHYYPFGLTMAGVSSKALAFGNPSNRLKFNDGSELSNYDFSDGSGLELYETPFRKFDAQLGRFWQPDPLAEEMDNWSPYTFSNNNPILLNDPLGLISDSAHPVEGPKAFVSASYNKRSLTMINTAGTSISKNTNYNPYSNYSPSYFISQAWNPKGTNEKLTFWQTAENIAIFVPWGRVIKGVRSIYMVGKAAQALRAISLARFARLAPLEQSIVTEVNLIMSSSKMGVLRRAYEKGISAEISIGSRTILYEPSLSASGLTMFGENGFVLGREAFATGGELEKTLLHELFRLNTSVVRAAGATASAVTSETNAAAQFAEKAVEFVKKLK